MVVFPSAADTLKEPPGKGQTILMAARVQAGPLQVPRFAVFSSLLLDNFLNYLKL